MEVEGADAAVPVLGTLEEQLAGVLQQLLTDRVGAKDAISALESVYHAAAERLRWAAAPAPLLHGSLAAKLCQNCAHAHAFITLHLHQGRVSAPASPTSKAHALEGPG